MEIILDFVNGGYNLTVIDKENKKRRRTNSTVKINNLLRDLPENPKVVIYEGNEAKIVYNQGAKLVLKNIDKHINKILYRQTFDKIDEKTPTVRNVKTNVKQIATIAASSLAFITLTGFAVGTFIVQNPTVNTPVSSTIITTQPESVEDIEVEEPLVLIDEQNYDLMYRVGQTKEYLNSSGEHSISSQLNEYTINKMLEFINSSNGQYCFDVCNDFGVDPYMFLSLMMKESSLNHTDTLPGGQYYNGCAIGICQLENPQGQEITAFNYTTNQNETIYETVENAVDINTNIKIGIMCFQNILEKYKGNQFLALQSYNYGQGLMDLIVCIYADEIGSSYDRVVENYQDTNWLKYVEQVHNDPIGFANSVNVDKYPDFKITIDYLKNWSYNTYGDGQYISGVLSYYIGEYGKSRVGDDLVETDYITGEVIKTAVETNEVTNGHKIS